MVSVNNRTKKNLKAEEVEKRIAPMGLQYVEPTDAPDPQASEPPLHVKKPKDGGGGSGRPQK